MVLAAPFAAIDGAWACGLPAPLGTDAGAVQAGPRPVHPPEISQPVQQGAVHPSPDAERLPLAQAPPAGHATAVAQLRAGPATAARAVAQRGCPPEQRN